MLKITITVDDVVALRKESVDRNVMLLQMYLLKFGVALRKESVDRNCPGTNTTLSITVSLSARRAWIEIIGCVLSG